MKTVREHPSGEADDESMLDAVAVRFGFRDRIRAHPVLGMVYRVGVGVIGALIIAVGIVLIPAPGPGWLIVFAGLGVLSTEFAWARRVLHFARRKVYGWTQWVTRRSLLVRSLIGLAGLLLLGGLLLSGLYMYGWRGFPFG
jgi:uncharacterized protein (TIGR02611 family)